MLAPFRRKFILCSTTLCQSRLFTPVNSAYRIATTSRMCSRSRRRLRASTRRRCSGFSIAVPLTSSNRWPRKNCKRELDALYYVTLLIHSYRHTRNWRWHRKLQIWLTKDEQMAPHILGPNHERGFYIVWDAHHWQRERVSRSIVTLFCGY